MMQKTQKKCIWLSACFMALLHWPQGATASHIEANFSDINQPIGSLLEEQNPVTITGKVTDEKGEGLPGASVLIKGAADGTITDLNGNYQLAIPNKQTTLVFSFIGYTDQEVLVGEQTTINIKLAPDVTSLEEVVVVGYSTQSKASITGSVAKVSARELVTRPAPNAANLVQGRVPGLQVIQSSAEPGRDNPTFLIRGRGSYGGSNSPLVLIDGVSGSFSNLSPDDIENITVLKDATSAALYGARAANGVILVTTKRGKKGDLSISYRSNFALHEATQLPNFITNSAEYMTMFNQAAERSNGITFRYPEIEIKKYANSSDRLNYPNFDYVDYYFQRAPVQNHNLSFSGGGEKNIYNFSLSYLDQKAILPGYDFKRYNALLNYTNEVSKKVSVGTSMNLTYKNREEPAIISEYMVLAIYAAGPTYGPFLPDGSGRVVSRAYLQEGKNRNPQEQYLMGDQQTQEYNLNAQAYVDVDLLPNLKWTSKVAVNYRDEFYKMHQKPYEAFVLQERGSDGDYAPFTYGPDILGVTDSYAKRITPTLYSTLSYNRTINSNHTLSVMAGYEQISHTQQGLMARRLYSAYPSLDELSAYTTEDEHLFPSATRLPGGTGPSEWALQSFFGSIKYDFKGKYMMETNARYDGTSRVSEDYRWGFFPSTSLGWLISEEDFITQNAGWVNMLKLRASYGVLGNSNVGTYLYQNNLTISGINYSFDNSGLQPGAILTKFRDPRLKWESTRIFDIGMDVDLFEGRFVATVDWYKKVTYDILTGQPVPASLGLGGPTLNDGKMQNKGVELNLGHDNRIGDVRYGANVQVSTAKNKLLHIKTPSYGSTIKEVGLPYESHYLYLWDGILQQDDYQDLYHEANPNARPGDLRMKDIDQNDTIDARDRVVVNGAYPDFIYSFGFNVSYKGFRLDAFFQGVEGVKARVYNWGVDPFTQGTPPTKEWRNAWTPENQSNTMPALYINGYPGVSSFQNSTYYLQDASYLRLKNIMFSYSIPKRWISKLKMKEMTVYVSGDNLLTFTKYTGADPERADLTGNYVTFPQARIYNAGFNLKF